MGWPMCSSHAGAEIKSRKTFNHQILENLRYELQHMCVDTDNLYIHILSHIRNTKHKIFHQYNKYASSYVLIMILLYFIAGPSSRAV